MLPKAVVLVSRKHKSKSHMKEYAACQSKAFMTGSFTFLAGSAMAFVAQELISRWLPYSRKSSLLVALTIGTLSAYTVTRHKTKVCQDMWLALEEKHSVINPLEERLKEKAAGESSSRQLEEERKEKV